MKVLWCVNVPLPEQLKKIGKQTMGAGFWMASLAEVLQSVEALELVVVCVSPAFPASTSFEVDGVIYENIRETKKAFAADLHAVLVKHQPDVVHIHGTEKAYGLLQSLPRQSTIISIQGLLHVYKDTFWGNLSYIKRLAVPSLFRSYRQMCKGAVGERRIIQKNLNFGGRTIWDEGHIHAINPGANYYYLPELMRRSFSEVEWKIDSSEPNCIYTTSTPRSYKGTDVLIQAVALLKNKLPDIQLRIGGPFGDRPFSWSRHLRKAVKNCGLENNVEFIGFVDEQQIIEELKNTSVYVLPSFIENSPNSLAEAQMVGVPCVAAAAGGVFSMIRHEDTGLLTPVGDAAVLAQSIRRVLSDGMFASRLGAAGRKEAHRRYDRGVVRDCYIKVYQELAENV